MTRVFEPLPQQMVQRPSQHPQGHLTRGKTARNRLRRVDNFLLMTQRSLLMRQAGAFKHACYVDLGYGAEPFTTLESAARLRQARRDLPVLGVEIDVDRVAAAQPYTDSRTDFRLGGFNVPVRSGETIRLIRAFNVLRQYDEAQVHEAWQIMGRTLLDGGLMIEGTSDPFGRIWVANLLRRREDRLVYESLLFSTNFRWGFTPEIFQPVLPKNLTHRMVPGEPIYTFMDAWQRAARDTIALRTWGLSQWFAASAENLAADGFRIDGRRKLTRQGFLWWQDAPGVRELPL